MEWLDQIKDAALPMLGSGLGAILCVVVAIKAAGQIIKTVFILLAIIFVVLLFKCPDLVAQGASMASSYIG